MLDPEIQKDVCGALRLKDHVGAATWCGLDADKAFHGEDNHFGLTDEEHSKLFGISVYGTLQSRYDYLCNLIREREKALVPSGSEICKEIMRPVFEQTKQAMEVHL